MSQKIYIDASVLTATEAVGRVFGVVVLAAVPSIGSTVNLGRSSKLTLPPDGFSGHLKVKDTIFSIAGAEGDESVMILLDDIVASSSSLAVEIGDYLSREYGLDFDSYL